MKINNKRFITICLLLTALLTFSACDTTMSSDSTTTSTSASTQKPTTSITNTDTSPLGKYDPPITITTIRSIVANRTYMPGETWDNNIWTQAFEEKLGIKFEYLWNVDSTQYTDKLNVAIATNDLPEYIPTLNYDQFYSLAKAGKLADITEAYETYATSYVKRVVEIADSVAFKMDSIDGKLYGLGTSPNLFWGHYLLFYRDDWANNLGIAKPQTFDDIVSMAYAFAHDDPNNNGIPTVGIGVSQNIFDGPVPLTPVFAAYDAYPTIWVDNGEGSLVFGATQSAVRDVLLKLQQWYNDGVIDADFFTLGDWDGLPDSIVKEKVGLAFGVAWFPDFKCKDLFELHGNKNPTWTCMTVPSTDGSLVKNPIMVKQSNIGAMTVQTEYPEAMVKIVNLYTTLLHDPDTSEGKYHDQTDPAGNVVNNYFHAQPLVHACVDPFLTIIQAERIQNAFATNNTANLTGEEMSYYDRAKNFQDGTDLSGYMGWAIYADPNGTAMQVKRLYESGSYLMDAYQGPNTETMNDNMSNLISKRNEVFSRIIAGGDIAEFDEWISFWQTQGGDTITKEVNDWYRQE